MNINKFLDYYKMAPRRTSKRTKKRVPRRTKKRTSKRVPRRSLECKIVKNKLIKPCEGQPTTKGSVCYKNKCKPIKTLLSENSADGNVVRLDNGLIAKWNKKHTIGSFKYPDEDFERLVTKEVLDDSILGIKNEINFQKYLSKHHIAPEIYENYEYSKQNTSDSVYFFMEDLHKKGYESINNFNPTPARMVLEIIKTVVKMHKLGIAHRDLHGGNIMYNPKINKIKIIDFGRAVSEKNKYAASLMEHAINIRNVSIWDLFLMVTYYDYAARSAGIDHRADDDPEKILKILLTESEKALRKDINYNLLITRHKKYLYSESYSEIFNYNLDGFILEPLKNGFPQQYHRH
jgi:serine/threonine protein kinase